MNSTFVKVSIQGTSYTIKTDQDEELARKAASLVDEQLKELKAGSFALNQKAFVLVALRLAHRLVCLEHEIEMVHEALKPSHFNLEGSP